MNRVSIGAPLSIIMNDLFFLQFTLVSYASWNSLFFFIGAFSSIIVSGQVSMAKRKTRLEFLLIFVGIALQSCVKKILRMLECLERVVQFARSLWKLFSSLSPNISSKIIIHLSRGVMSLFWYMDSYISVTFFFFWRFTMLSRIPISMSSKIFIVPSVFFAKCLIRGVYDSSRSFAVLEKMTIFSGFTDFKINSLRITWRRVVFPALVCPLRIIVERSSNSSRGFGS